MSTAIVTTLAPITTADRGGAFSGQAFSGEVRIQSAQPRLRLTKRGRVVFTSLAAVPVVAGVMLLALNGGGATATSSGGAQLEEVTVQAGQSLWSLAEDIAPDVDPRDVVSDILSVNQLQTGSVQAGQRLMLPAEYTAE
jgi:hypothetical protein